MKLGLKALLFTFLTTSLAVVGCAATTDDDADDERSLAAQADGSPEDPNAPDMTGEEDVGQTSDELRACAENCRGLTSNDVKKGRYTGKGQCCKVGVNTHGYAAGWCAFYKGKSYQTGSGTTSKWLIRYCNGFKCTGGHTVTKACY